MAQGKQAPFLRGCIDTALADADFYQTAGRAAPDTFSMQLLEGLGEEKLEHAKALIKRYHTLTGERYLCKTEMPQAMEAEYRANVRRRILTETRCAQHYEEGARQTQDRTLRELYRRFATQALIHAVRLGCLL